MSSPPTDRSEEQAAPRPLLEYGRPPRHSAGVGFLIASLVFAGLWPIACYPLVRKRGAPIDSPLILVALLLPLLVMVLGRAAQRLAVAKGDPRVRRWGAWAVGLGGVELLALITLPFVLPPPLRRASESANGDKCAANLRQIGVSLFAYAQANNGRFPPAFDRLVIDQGIETWTFVCPSSNDEHARGATTREVVNELLNRSDRCSYVYAGAGLAEKAVTQDHVLAYEPLKHHQTGINVLFGDGRTEWLSRPLAERLIAELAAGHNPPRLR